MTAIKIKLNSFIPAIPFFFLIASCATDVRVSTPSSHFITSESSGKSFAGSFTLQTGEGSTSSLDLREKDLDAPFSYEKESHAKLKAELGIIKSLDGFIHNTFGSRGTPFMFGLKYQLYGKSRKESSVGNNSIAVTISAGSGSYSLDGDDNPKALINNEFSGTEINHSVIASSLIFGRRVHEDLLMYFSLNFAKHTVNVDVKSNKTPALDGESFSRKTDEVGAALGAVASIGNNLIFGLEASLQTIEWEKSEANTNGFVNAMFGFKMN